MPVSEVALEWEIADTVATVGTDRACNMIAAASMTPYGHMQSSTHYSEGTRRDRGFVNALMLNHCFPAFICRG